jgi:elongation factor P
MISTNDLRPGVCFEYDNEYWQVAEFQHVKPGKGPAFVRVKIRNLKKGGVVERTFRAGEKVQDLRVENRSAQYLYKSGDLFVFMDNESFDQTEIPEERMQQEAGFMDLNFPQRLL